MKIRTVLSLMLVLSLLLTAFAGCAFQGEDDRTQPTAAPTEAPVKPMVRSGVETVLILCTDAMEVGDTAGGFRNAARADFLLLMVIDGETQTITPVQINPDCEVSFWIPGRDTTVPMPVGHTISYGSGGSDSCLHILDAVSGLLEKISVDHYLLFTMDSVALVNDSVGGVRVPASAELAEETEAESILLSGSEAVDFFSFRGETDVTNAEHMLRQQQYMQALYGPFMECAKAEDFLTDLSLRLGENMATDLTLSQLILMFETFAAYTLEEEVLTLPGEILQTEEGIRFCADPAAVHQLLERLIYE